MPVEFFSKMESDTPGEVSTKVRCFKHVAFLSWGPRDGASLSRDSREMGLTQQPFLVPLPQRPLWKFQGAEGEARPDSEGEERGVQRQGGAERRGGGMWVGPSVAAVVESLIPPQGEGHSRAGGDAGGRDGVVVVGG